MKAFAENNTRKVGTIWTLGPDEPAAVVMPLIAATFRCVGTEYALSLADAMGGGAAREVMGRFESGRRCYAAWVENTLAAYGWVSYGEEFIGELGLYLRLLPWEAYIWDCFTVPAFRQKYLYSALLVYILGELRAGSINRVWIGANLDNVPSQLGIDRAGFRRVADLVVTRVEAQRYLWAQGYSRVPDSLIEEARRVFLDNRDKVWLKSGSLTG